MNSNNGKAGTSQWVATGARNNSRPDDGKVSARQAPLVLRIATSGVETHLAARESAFDRGQRCDVPWLEPRVVASVWRSVEEDVSALEPSVLPIITLVLMPNTNNGLSRREEDCRPRELDAATATTGASVLRGATWSLASNPAFALRLTRWGWRLEAGGAIGGTALLVGVALAGASLRAAWLFAAVAAGAGILARVPTSLLTGKQIWRVKTLVGLSIGAAATIVTVAVLAAGFWITGMFAGETAPSTSLGAFRICSGCASSGADLSHYHYIVLNAWDYERIPSLKQANPSVKVLLYKDMASSRSYSCGGLIPAGIDYCWADANKPSWFTHKGGARIQWAGFSGHWQMNIGLGDYQSQWATNVISELRSNGWDGVVIDNANIDPSGYAALPYDEYPTRQSYQDATRSFLANVGPKIQSAGFLIIPNIQHDRTLLTKSLWKDWIQFTSGGHLEHYTKWGSYSSGQYGGIDWEDSGQVFERDTEAAGKIFIGTFYAPTSDVRSMRYARASFLLDWDGGPSALAFIPNPDQVDPWSPEWTVDIGTPVGSRYQVGSAYRRDYTGGTVVVNPSSGSQRVDLGAMYSMPGSSTVTSVALAPMTGLVLRSVTLVGPPR